MDGGDNNIRISSIFMNGYYFKVSLLDIQNSSPFFCSFVPSPLRGMLKSLLFISYIFIYIFLWGWGRGNGQNPVQPLSLTFTIIKVVKP